MKLVIAVENRTAHLVDKWDVIETDRGGTVIDDEFVLPFGSWDHAVRELTRLRDKARAVERGEIAPDCDHEIIAMAG